MRDVVEANILAATSENVGNGEIINIGNGDNRSINQIAEIMGGKAEFIPSVKEPRISLADNSKAKNTLGWSPSTTVEDWLPKYMRCLGLKS